MRWIWITGLTFLLGIACQFLPSGSSGRPGPDGQAMPVFVLPNAVFPAGMAVDTADNLYVVAGQQVVREDARTHLVTLVAGVHDLGYGGDGGPATEASLYNPTGLAVDYQGNLYILDSWNARVREVDGATGTISTVAGTGVEGYVGDGGPAAAAELQVRNSWGQSLAVDADGYLYCLDGGTGDYQLPTRIRRVELRSGTISTVAIQGTSETAGTTTSQSGFSDLAVSPDGTIYALAQQVVWRIQSDGTTAMTFPSRTGTCADKEAVYATGIAITDSGVVLVRDGCQDTVVRLDGPNKKQLLAQIGAGGPGRIHGLLVAHAGDLYLPDDFRRHQVLKWDHQLKQVSPSLILNDGVIGTPS